MKKLILFIILLIAFTIFCVVVTTDNRDKFYLLNWGEYMNPEVLSEFEDKFNISVVMEEVGSSEEMYQKVKTGTTKYDVAIPGDYIIEKMQKEDLIEQLNYDYLTNYQDGILQSDLENLIKDSFFENSLNYTIPYFWGAYSIIYSTKDPQLEKDIKQYGFDMFFNQEMTSKYNVGMYDVPRWVVSCYLLNNNINVNETNLSLYEDEIISQVKSANYSLWGDDILKKQVAEGNIDYAFVQLGDFFDQYYVSLASNEEINFNAYIPSNTAGFFDGMVIPKISENKELAHEFINYFLQPEVYKENAEYVGYAPTNSLAIELMKDNELNQDVINNYEFYLDPLKGKTAVLFRDLGVEYQTKLEEIINNAKN